ncbi:MAG: hypothetical protein EON93_01420 [Burkholderiales bacterium]|nr:MAG: hypothetical protein EON93_01420 [Burkholderiales bacterium]
MPIQPADILAELHNLATRRIAFCAVSDWYSNTDLASYFRIVAALSSSEPISLATFVAWSLSRDVTSPDFEPEQWLINCRAEPVTSEELAKAVRYVLPQPAPLDISDLPYGWDERIPQHPSIVPPNAAIDVREAYELRGVQTGCNKRRYGPTRIFFWERSDWMFYLEEHLES